MKDLIIISMERLNEKKIIHFAEYTGVQLDEFLLTCKDYSLKDVNIHDHAVYVNGIRVCSLNTVLQDGDIISFKKRVCSLNIVLEDGDIISFKKFEITDDDEEYEVFLSSDSDYEGESRVVEDEEIFNGNVVDIPLITEEVRSGRIKILDMETLFPLEEGDIEGNPPVSVILSAHDFREDSKVMVNGVWVNNDFKVKDGDFIIVYNPDYLVPVVIHSLINAEQIVINVKKGTDFNEFIQKFKFDSNIHFYTNGTFRLTLKNKITERIVVFLHHKLEDVGLPAQKG